MIANRGLTTRSFVTFCLAILFVLGSKSLMVAADPVPIIGWNVLKALTASTPTNAPVRQLDHKVISIPGFMVPLEDDAQEVTEFLLVPYAGACIHVPPPPPNQMIYVVLQHGTKAKMSFTEPIIVTGELKISTIKSPYGDVSYNMNGLIVKPYTE